MISQVFLRTSGKLVDSLFGCREIKIADEADAASQASNDDLTDTNASPHHPSIIQKHLIRNCTTFIIHIQHMFIDLTHEKELESWLTTTLEPMCAPDHIWLMRI